MEKKKLQTMSIAALIISVIPFVALIPAFLKIVLPNGLRTVWSGVNIAPFPSSAPQVAHDKRNLYV